MLAEIAHLTAVEMDVTGYDHLFAGFALVVDHLGIRDVNDFPARVFGPPAQVEFFRVHEEPLIEGPHLFDDLAAHHQTGAVLLGRNVLTVIASAPGVAGPMPGDGRAFHQRRHERGKAIAGGLQGAVGVAQFRVNPTFSAF